MRWNAALSSTLLVTLCGAVLVGCGKTSTSTGPTALCYDPDLEAYEAYLDWGPGIPIGGPTRAGEAWLEGSAGTTKVAHASNVVVVGTPAMPAFRVVTEGVRGSCATRFYLDDQLWWEVSAPVPPIPRGVLDLGGKSWVPPDTGVYVFRMVVDPDSLVAEVDEANNERRLEVRVIPGDLRCAILDFLQWQNGAPHEVAEVQVNTPVDIVVLTGAEGSYPNHRLVLSACGSVVLDRRESLSGGTLWNAWRLDTLSFTPASTGTCQVRFDVDPDGEFMDRDRQNNTATRTLTVRP